MCVYILTGAWAHKLRAQRPVYRLLIFWIDAVCDGLKTTWQSRSSGESSGGLQEGGTELIEVPFGAQIA